MRGMTRFECRRLAKVGDRLKVGSANLPIPGSGECDLVYGLGDDKSKELVFATPGTRLKIIEVSQTSFTVLPALFGQHRLGHVISTWLYQGRKREEETATACFCFFYEWADCDPTHGLIMPWDLDGVGFEVIAVPPDLPVIRELVRPTSNDSGELGF